MVVKYNFKKPTMTQAQWFKMMEALRRYIRFSMRGDGEDLRTRWTGLGYASEYAPVVNAGWMEWVSGSPPAKRCMQWLRLTEEGAKIIQNWIDAGYTELSTDKNHVSNSRNHVWEYPCNSTGHQPPRRTEI